MSGKKRNKDLQFVLSISAISMLKYYCRIFIIILSLFRFGMGIEFREGSLLITSKNNHIAKKGKITNKPRNKDLFFSLFYLTK